MRRLCVPGLERPREIHKLRVAIRRMRVAMSALRDLVGTRRRKVVDRELRRLLRLLGPVREWDVLLGDLAHGSAARPEIDSKDLREAAARRRRRAIRKVHPRLARAGAGALRAHVRQVRRRVMTSRAGLDRRSLRILAREVLGRRLGKAQARASGIDVNDPHALHRLRVQIKKLRHASELFAGLFPRANAVAFVVPLKQMQDCLGAAHDAVVEHEQLGGLQRGLRARARALLGSTDQGCFGAGTFQIEDSLRELGRLRPFWIVPPAWKRGSAGQTIRGANCVALR